MTGGWVLADDSAADSGDRHARARGGYNVFLAEVAVLTALLVLVGYWPTVRLAGDAALPALLSGCAIGLAGSLLGSVPVWRVRGRPLAAALPAVLGAVGLRLAVALGLGLTAVLSTGWAPAPLLVWVALSHGVLLLADVRLALRLVAAAEPSI